jgi:hypothetical protein
MWPGGGLGQESLDVGIQDRAYDATVMQLDSVFLTSTSNILSAFAGFVGTTVDPPPLHWTLIERRLQC